MLYTNSILAEKSLEDGIRISVMSRHTLNDGITPDPKINFNSYDEHLKIFGPPTNLIGDYYKRGLPWEEFESRYLNYIRKQETVPVVKQLAQRSTIEDITLLCVEDSAEKCHRRLLAEECQRYEPDLKIEHR